MSSARIQNVDALKHFRIALIKFAEAARVSLGDAEGEVQRTATWLAGEQQQFWQTQIRKRHEIVNRCKDAVRQKKLFKDATGRTQSAVDEEKLLRKAIARHEEAEQKLLNTRRHSAKIAKELHMYKGAVQTFATNVASDLPNAIATLDRMIQALEAYLSLTASSGIPEAATDGGSAGAAEPGSSMTRSEVEALTQPPNEEEAAEVRVADGADDPEVKGKPEDGS